jgi:hypothetical protein
VKATGMEKMRSVLSADQMAEVQSMFEQTKKAA